MTIRIETQYGPFEIDPVDLEFYQVSGDLGCPMVPDGVGRWLCDVPMGYRYLVEKLVNRRKVSYVLYQVYELDPGDKHYTFLGDVTCL